MASEAPDRWQVLLGPGPVEAIRQQLSLWREDHEDVPTEDIRLDLVRVGDGEQLRVCLRVIGN